MANDLLYRSEVYNAVYNVLMQYLAEENIPKDLFHDILKTITGMPSTYWHPCDDENNVPPKNEEVLVTLKYPNGKTEVAFGEHWGENRNGDIAYWGGQNELVVAWGEVPSAYEGDAHDH